MEESWVGQLTVLALASWQATETLHHGSVFAEKRAEWELRGGFRGGLAVCAFCLSHWPSIVLVVGSNLLAGLPVVGSLMTMILWSLAVTRLAQLGNDWAWTFTRTPGRKMIPLSAAGEAAAADDA